MRLLDKTKKHQCLAVALRLPRTQCQRQQLFLLGGDIDSRRWDQGGFLLRRIIKNLLTHRYHACLMCAAQVTSLKAAFPIFIQYPWHSIPTVQVGQHQSTSKAGRSYPKWPSPSYTKASHAYSSLPAAGYCGTCGWGREQESLDPVVLGIASELFFLTRR